MSHRHAQSALLLTVDLERAGDLSPGAQLRTAHFCDGLLDTLDRLRISATWGLTDPGNSVLARAITSRRTDHEVAVVADPAWAQDRVLFAKELTRRIEHARALGIRVSSLFTSQLEIGPHLDLLVKNRVRVVRSENTSNRQWFPHSERYGVWEPPQALDLSHTQPWWLGGNRAIRRSIGLAIDSGDTCHLALNVAELISREQEIRGIENSLRVAAGRVSRGEMVSTTLSHQVAQLGFVRTAGPARSILRAA